MDDIRILQTDLPELGPETKAVVNNGLWALYVIEDDNPEHKYMLAAGNKYYLLNNKGNPVKELNRRPSGIRLKGNVYFSDLPFPENISLPFPNIS